MNHLHFVAIAAIGASAISGVLYHYLVGQSLSNDPVISLPGTVIGTLITTALCWWGFISRPQKPNPLRGGFTGLLISLLSFPVAFTVTLIISIVQDGLPPNAGATEYFLYIFGLGLLAIAAVGIFTIPIGVVGGSFLAYLQQKTVRNQLSPEVETSG